MGSKTCWDQRLVGIKDWRSKKRYGGIEHVEIRWDQRTGTEDIGDGSVEGWGSRARMEEEENWSGEMRRWERRMVGIGGMWD